MEKDSASKGGENETEGMHLHVSWPCTPLITHVFEIVANAYISTIKVYQFEGGNATKGAA